MHICVMSEDVVLLQKMVVELTDTVAQLREELKFLKRHIFGKKTERFISAPGQLTIEGLEIQRPEPTSQNSVPIQTLNQEKQKPVR